MNRQTSSSGSAPYVTPRNVNLSLNNNNSNNAPDSPGMMPASTSANFFQRSSSHGGFMNNNNNPLAEQLMRAKIPLLQVIDEALRKQEFGNSNYFQSNNN